jgi:Flp pilus assembly protein TadG
MALSRFSREQSGAAMVEMAIALPLFLILLLGFVDFGYAFNQWNEASKAAEVGARLAAVSTPVANGLASEGAAPTNSDEVGEPVEAGEYDYGCSASSAGTVTCSCEVSADPHGTSCADTSANAEAFKTIVCGDRLSCGTDFNACSTNPNLGRPGMCDFFPSLKASEVHVHYSATGLGYWTRPGGAVPTIKVSIVGHQFQFFFIAGLLNLASSSITMPDMLSTVTGEDLDSASP